MHECFHCGCKAVNWDSEFTFEDIGKDGEGLVCYYHCMNCGAEIEYYIKTDEGKDSQEVAQV